MLLRIIPLSFLFVSTIACSSHAHFLWLKSDANAAGHEAVLYFSEAAHTAGNRIPEKVAGTPIHVRYGRERPEPVALHRVEEGGVAELRGPLKEESYAVSARCEYGVYQGFLLHYDAESVNVKELGELEQMTRTESHLLDITLKTVNDKLVIATTLRGKAVSSAEVLVVDAGGDRFQKKTNDQGETEVSRLASGLVGIMATYIDPDQKGESNGVNYSGAHYYSTLTLVWPASMTSQTNASLNQQPPTNSANSIAELPEAITSFGAVGLNNGLYVYGGHTGTAHDHSRDNLSRHFRRYDYDTKAWEELPMQRPLQGLALVAHDKWIYRVGGMEARNAQGAEADMHSVNEFSRFDTETHEWETLPSLPHGRSSHDGVVADGRLYVVGGWELSGEAEGTWHDDPLVIDLRDPAASSWTKLPRQPSRRRALAVAAAGQRIYAICGIDGSGNIDRSVDVFDVVSGTWEPGPKLPGEGMNGFGVAAWNHRGAVYTSGIDGIVYRLTTDGGDWELVGKLSTGRFFHRFVSYGNEGILAVGGASRTGHTSDIELVNLDESRP